MWSTDACVIVASPHPAIGPTPGRPLWRASSAIPDELIDAGSRTGTAGLE